MMQLAEKSLEQRQARARLKEELRTKHLTLREMLDHPLCQNTPVWKAVAWQWRYVREAPSKAARILEDAGIEPTRTVARLTDRQRTILCELNYTKRNEILRHKAQWEDGKSWYCETCGTRLRERATVCGFCELEAHEASAAD